MSLGAFNARTFLMERPLSSMLACKKIATGSHIFVSKQVLHSIAFLCESGIPNHDFIYSS